MLLLSACFLISFNAAAQARGELKIIEDPRVDSLIARRLAASKTSSNRIIANTGRGYRVQFFISPSKNEIYQKQAEFNQLYPDLRTYIIYQEPNYKIKAGDFRSRLEAQKLLHDLRSTYPTLFIISEKINLPKPETGDDQN